MDMTAYWVLAVLSSVLVGAAKGGLPVVGMLSVPIMSIVIPPTVAAGLLLPIYILSDMYGIWLYRGSFSKRNLAILMPAAAIGIFVGWGTVSYTDENVVKLLIGLMGLAFLANTQRSRLKKNSQAGKANVAPGVFWGSIAGFTSFISHSGGPPFQIYVLPQRLEKMMFAGTSTILFSAINLMKLPPYIMLGQVSFDSLQAGAVLIPVALFGAWAGYKLTKILPEKVFFVFVEIALFLVSVKLTYDGFVGWFGA